MSIFDYKNFLLENKLGAYSKASLNEISREQAEEAAKQAGDYETAVAALEDLGLTPFEANIIATEIYGEEDVAEAKEADPIDPEDPYGTGGVPMGGWIEEDEITEGDEDLKRDLIGKYGKNITVSDIKSEYPGMEDRDAGQLLKRLGLGIDMLKRTPKGGMRRDYGTGPTTGRTAGDALKRARENVMFKKLDQKFGNFLFKAKDSATSGQHLVNILNKTLEKKGQGKLSPQEAEYAASMWRSKQQEGLEEGAGFNKVDDALEMLKNLHRNVSTNSNLNTEEKQGMLNAFEEIASVIEDLGADMEREGEDDYASDYSKRRASELDEAANPEGDALVKRFLTGVAKKFEYGIEDAARFVKDTITKLGY